ncbi:hypothetical protein P7228_03425 [Altererythrobacter arenosus]|uniref:Stability/partitioning determinant n=1 Tax=Altererythrobacter arenosus TaxID=3032592 RepID=A0ABY8FSY5_9SPHN|nr:hypothetical protein [Altererythrobacter sp. CAU 1644]WFL78132.1 hypothetical protein P7228_03425 [Altererythrobacter sp. CAU 1644]
MTEASFASLSPTLLARKGGAKPAMRPQLGPIPNPTADSLEDLGWNDMGHDDDEARTAEVVQLKPANSDSQADQPIVRKQVEQLAKSIEQDNSVTPAKPAKARKSAIKQGKRAAFTLRLDADRHLKLRLAATMQGKSAQSLVTAALDALLDEIDDLESLAARMKRN